MTQLSREEFVELGISTPTEAVIEWTTRQLAAAKGKEALLQSRGVNAAYLTGVQDLLAGVQKRRQQPEDGPPPQAALAQRIREEAVEYWREAKQIVEAEFGTSPDLLAKFRTGVRTGLLIGNLAREIDCMVAQLREHASRLASLGVTEEFIARGALLVTRLREVKEGLDTACRALPAPATQHYHDKGLLYDLTRKLVRTGRLACILDPGQASAFNFTGVSRKPRGSRKAAKA